MSAWTLLCFILRNQDKKRRSASFKVMTGFSNKCPNICGLNATVQPVGLSESCLVPKSPCQVFLPGSPRMGVPDGCAAVLHEVMQGLGLRPSVAPP